MTGLLMNVNIYRETDLLVQHTCTETANRSEGVTEQNFHIAEQKLHDHGLDAHFFKRISTA